MGITIALPLPSMDEHPSFCINTRVQTIAKIQSNDFKTLLLLLNRAVRWLFQREQAEREQLRKNTSLGMVLETRGLGLFYGFSIGVSNGLPGACYPWTSMVELERA